MLRGEEIPDSKVRKEIARPGYRRTMDNLAYRPRSQTPPGIRLFTPPSSPSFTHDHLMEHHHASSLIRKPTHASWTDEALLVLAESTPWKLFIDYIRPLTTGSGDLLAFTVNYKKNHFIKTSPDIYNHTDVIQTFTSS